MNSSEHAPWIDSDLAELIATIQSGQRPYGGVTEDGGDIPSLGGENIREGGGIELSTVKKVSSEFFRSMTKGVLADEDVLINKDGANSGKVGLYEGQFPAASINEHLFLLRGKVDRIAQRFLYRVLSSEDGQRAIRAKISGSAQPGLKSDFIRNFPVRVPESTVEQSRISAVLDSVDEAIEKTEAGIAKLKQVRSGLLHDLLTCGLDEDGHLRDPIAHPEQFKDSPLGRIPGPWEIRTLEQVTVPSAPICYGIVQPLDFVHDGVPVLAIRDILGDYRTGLHRTAPEIDARYARSRVRAGDVLISVKGTIGRIGLVPTHYAGNISRDLARIRSVESVIPHFLVHLLRSSLGQKTLELAQVGTTRAELSIAPLKRLSFAFPTSAEQKRIAVLLDYQDALIEAYDNELTKLTHLKAGLMADLLTGRVRVPELLFAMESGP